MNTFPKMPFTLNRIGTGKARGDAELINYLKRTENFRFLGEKPIGDIEKLDPGKPLNGGKQMELLDLWAHVLADAIKEMKKLDRREWDKKNPHMGTFFHEGSLGIHDLKNILKGFAQFEGMLYGASPERYRDHLAHAFRVWIVGQAILKDEVGFGGRLSLDTDLVQITPVEWECMWAIVALCHDLGYPLQAIDWINNRARDAFGNLGLVHAGDLRFTFSQHGHPFNDTIIKLMASKLVPLSWEEPAPDCGAAESDASTLGDFNVSKGKSADGAFLTHLQNKYYLKLLKSFDKLDHGIASALLISKALTYFLESDLTHDSFGPLDAKDARQFVIRREILRAIAAHTCPDIYHLRFNTLSFLLYMVDEIQCWGRPTLGELQRGSDDIGESQAEVRAFNANKVDLVVTTPEDDWDGEQTGRAERKLETLRRMLRLAVDTRKLSKVSLRFVLRPRRDNKQVELCLEDGKLTPSWERPVEQQQTDA